MLCHGKQDLNLPIVTGFEVLQWITASPDLSGISILVLTLSRNPADVETCRRLGVKAFLVKPISNDQRYRLALFLQEQWLCDDPAMIACKMDSSNEMVVFSQPS